MPPSLSIIGDASMIKMDVRLTNGEEDSCIVNDEDAFTVIEAFMEKGVLLIGVMGDFVSVYPAASVFSFNAYKWED